MPDGSASASLDSALSLASLGFLVVWVYGIRPDGSCACGDRDCGKSAGKHPVLPRWTDAATGDPDRLRQQFAVVGRIALNVGILLGPQPSGRYLVAVDVDSADRLAVLEREIGPLPRTLAIGSARGDKRLYHLALEGQDPSVMRNVTGLAPLGQPFASGVDVKVAGGQVVAPGSTHVSGRPYVWQLDMKISDLPQAWYEAMRRPVRIAAPVSLPVPPIAGARVSRARAYIAKMPASVSEQGGHSAAFRVARKLAQDFQLTREETWGLLVEFNQRCSPPWSEKDLLHKLNEAYTKANVSNPVEDRPLAESSFSVSHAPTEPPDPWDEPAASAPSASPPQPSAWVPPPAPQAHVIPILGGRELAAELPPLEYLIEGIGMVAGGGAPDLFAGYGFSGKTMALQSMLLSLAAGRSVWGVHACTPRRVLHVDLEQGARLTTRRYQRLAAAMGLDLAELGDSIAVAVMPKLGLHEQHAAAWKALMAGYDLVMVDSLRAATGGIDENSSEMRGALDLLGQASEATGCHGIVIHHSRKPTEDSKGGRYSIRGSGAIYDGVDGAYILSAGRDEPVAVEHAKARSHGELLPDWALVISDVEVGGNLKGGLRVQVHGAELLEETRTNRAAEQSRQQGLRDGKRVRDALAASPGLSTTELRAAAKLSGDRLTMALVSLGPRVRVTEEREGRTLTRKHFLTP